MSRLPACHNDSFARLLAEGYVLYRRGAYVVGKVPFLDEKLQLREGLLADVMVIGAAGNADQPADHRFYFVGGTPHKLDRSVLDLGGVQTAIELFDDVKSSHWTSFKLKGAQGQNRAYVDFYEKFKTYFGVISAPAKELYPDYELTPFVGAESDDADNPFVFDDAHAARAGTNDLRSRLLGDKIAILGAGGTGGYVLDILSKSPVCSIDIFDDDEHKVHNSFRWPGPTLREDLGRNKAELLKGRYEHTHKRISYHSERLHDSNAQILDECTFAFICVDNELARQTIARLLFDKGMPFIDVGMGLSRGSAGLVGMLRVTLSRPGAEEKAKLALLSEGRENVDDEYKTNIQTADLNALNAALAVFMYKKFRGYYDELPAVWQVLFTTSTNSLVRHVV